jgi:hypothetical protein
MRAEHKLERWLIFTVNEDEDGTRHVSFLSACLTFMFFLFGKHFGSEFPETEQRSWSFKSLHS